jgi:drug/metabolite transporter (DMT)-like permease
MFARTTMRPDVPRVCRVVAIVLALYTSAAYGVANFLAPVLMRRHAFATVLLVGQLAALVGSVALLAISRESLPPLHAVGLAAVAGLGNAAGLAGFYEAVRFGPLSVAAPVGATSAVLPVMVGVAGGDALAAIQVVGIVLAIGGAMLAARRVSTADDAAHWDLPRCVFFAAVSALGLGVLLSAIPGAAEDGGLFWALTVQRSVIVLCFVALIATRGQTFGHPVGFAPRTPGTIAALLAPGALLLSGTLVYVLATERGQLSLVAVCGSLAPLVTVGLAIAALGERVSRAQAAGVVAAVAGVCLIAL